MATVRKRAYPILVRAHVRGSQLQPGVAAELARYFHSRPDGRACEAAEHSFDPLADPARYMAQELGEPAHAALRNAGPLTVAGMTEWEHQEDAEHRGHDVAKDEPGGGDVHIDDASGEVSVAFTTRKRRKPVDADVEVLKADDEKRIVYGEVLVPDVEDAQGDVVSKDDIELAAHRFLYAQAPIGDQHRKLAPSTVRPVESYIAPCDFEMGTGPDGKPHVVAKGTWVLATHVPEDDLWQQVKNGWKAAYSVAGTGRRTPA